MTDIRAVPYALATAIGLVAVAVAAGRRQQAFGELARTGKFCARKSGRLSYRQKKNLPASAFGLSKERKYPMSDVSHARNAKARASAEFDRGVLTKSQLRQINRKADRLIAACR